MKICRRCETPKQDEEFYVHAEMADGYLSFCKECVKKRIRKYNQENADMLSIKEKRRYQRRRKDPTFQQKKSAYNRIWRTPEKRLAHNITARKLKHLKPENCERCKIRPAEMAHHPDYSKPDKVEWICYRCHSRLRINLQTLGGLT
ncbi:MAG: hypothetical protein V3V81_07955 [Candidatus Bathyarchaeia archaeon]